MTDISSAALGEKQTRLSCEPVPGPAIYTLVPLFFIGLSVALFIAIVVRNVALLLCLIFLLSGVVSFIAWNVVSWRRNRAAIVLFLDSLPDSDLRVASEGKLVKITGAACCGSVSLESSYEKAARCIYTSTLLYEPGLLGLMHVNVNLWCFKWKLAYCERFSRDFYVTDRNSGIRAMVKAGSNCKVIPLVVETKLVSTSRGCNALSAHLRKWLRERNLPVEPRVLRLEEGYVQEGRHVTVVGMLSRDNGEAVIVQPPEAFSSGCLWRRLLLSVDIDGLVLRVSETEGLVSNQALSPYPPETVVTPKS